jgi:acetylglutamate kinase
VFRVVRRAGPGGEDIGFVGRIERVNAGVIEHVASDYIPVIASVGADRDGRSYNVNADEAAGAVAGGCSGRPPRSRSRMRCRASMAA